MLYPHSREELRKWFLSMETTLFRYRFRLESPESQVTFCPFLAYKESYHALTVPCHTVFFRGCLWVSFNFHTKHCHTRNLRYVFMVTLLTWTLMISVIFTVVRCSCFHVFRLSKTSWAKLHAPLVNLQLVWNILLCDTCSLCCFSTMVLRCLQVWSFTC